jgi:uncharacterized protein YyaL (SSP411 family)
MRILESRPLVWAFLLLVVFGIVGCGRRAMAKPQVKSTPQAATKEERAVNHLAGATSPYLLMHAHNPVDWYPWGDEALQRAKRENRPIFLSVGYSACHWCHVMEREDFENREVARLLNDHFVCIKVDREERPDIDAQYLLALQLMTENAGWPMSVWLTPDLKPFYGGTYYPPAEFKPLLEKISAVWRDEPDKVRAAADRVAQKMQEVTEERTRKATGAIPADCAQRAMEALSNAFDGVHGGFGRKPKFPEAPRLAFLLDQYRRSPRTQLLAQITRTLDGMAMGGIYDQIGGGFHRYSTDEKWRIPHFEKMLYDQAQLVPLYLETYRITRKPLYRRVAKETLDFVLREMTDPKTGGFYATVDADSEGIEGRYYVWTQARLKQALGTVEGERFAHAYGVTKAGNFGEGWNVLYVPMPLSTAQEAKLAPLRERLRAIRMLRVHPNLDDKVVTSWNGLMIAALARGYREIGEARYLKAAIAAADLLTKTMTTAEGQLLRSSRNGRAGRVSGFLDDYAFFANGLLSLYDATKERQWLQRAQATVDQMERRFWDKSGEGGFLSFGPDGAPVIQMREGEDSATPSPNGIAAQVLLHLANLRISQQDAGHPAGEEAHLRQQAAQTIQAFQSLLTRSPWAVPSLLVAWEQLRAGKSG